MFRTILASALFLAPLSAAPAAAACSGAAPAITSVAVKDVTVQGGLNAYDLSGTVVNRGDTGQAAGVMQFVDIYAGAVKLDSKGIPPLAAGQSYTFSYVSSRSRDAGDGTSRLRFQLDPQPSTECTGGSASYAVRF
jgi:hypothetical protein